MKKDIKFYLIPRMVAKYGFEYALVFSEIAFFALTGKYNRYDGTKNALASKAGVCPRTFERMRGAQIKAGIFRRVTSEHYDNRVAVAVNDDCEDLFLLKCLSDFKVVIGQASKEVDNSPVIEISAKDMPRGDNRRSLRSLRMSLLVKAYLRDLLAFNNVYRGKKSKVSGINTINLASALGVTPDTMAGYLKQLSSDGYIELLRNNNKTISAITFTRKMLTFAKIKIERFTQAYKKKTLETIDYLSMQRKRDNAAPSRYSDGANRALFGLPPN